MDTSNPNEPEETSYDTTDTEDMADEGMGKGEDQSGTKTNLKPE